MNSSSSALSVQKSTKSENSRSKSCDTVCTSNTSCYLQKRKPVHPLMYSLRPTYTRTSTNNVRQRVMSAKLLKLRSIQNQLNDANYHLSELTKENQILKNLQKRQDKALSKYENTNADLPRLLHSHEEQMRILTEKNKTQRKMLRELNDLLKAKEEELVKVQDKLNHLEKLNRDKRLLDREKLMDQIEELNLKLSKSEEQVSILNRKLMLESKSAKHRLNFEITKHRLCQKELGQALVEIDRLTTLLQKSDNTVRPTKNRFSRLAQRQSLSMVTLNENYPQNPSRSSDEKLTGSGSEVSLIKTPVTDVKLEPIKCKIDETAKKTNDILIVPSENVKNRLSSASTKSRSSEENLFLPNGFSSGSNHSLSSHDSPLQMSPPETVNEVQNHTETDLKLVMKLSENLDQAIQKATDNANITFDKNLANYCSQVLDNVKTCSKRIEVHKESLKIAKEDTDTLIETFKKTQLLESKLKDSLGLLEEKEDFSNLLPEEFQTFKPIKDKNDNIKSHSKVKLEERKKLLATLKAIDNGESVESIESIEEVPQKALNSVPDVFRDVVK